MFRRAGHGLVPVVLLGLFGRPSHVTSHAREGGNTQDFGGSGRPLFAVTRLALGKQDGGNMGQENENIVTIQAVQANGDTLNGAYRVHVKKVEAIGHTSPDAAHTHIYLASGSILLVEPAAHEVESLLLQHGWGS